MARPVMYPETRKQVPVRLTKEQLAKLRAIVEATDGMNQNDVFVTMIEETYHGLRMAGLVPEQNGGG